jgi:hypothetical protein
MKLTVWQAYWCITNNQFLAIGTFFYSYQSPETLRTSHQYGRYWLSFMHSRCSYAVLGLRSVVWILGWNSYGRGWSIGLHDDGRDVRPRKLEVNGKNSLILTDFRLFYAVFSVYSFHCFLATCRASIFDIL